MSIDLEHELRLAMHQHTDDVVAPPDLLTRVRPRRRPVMPRLALPLAAAAAVVAAVLGAVTLAVHPGSSGSVSVADTFADWGPARGDLAGDPATLRAITAEWAHPAGHNADAAGFDPVHGDRPLQVLWAGQTPDGPAAYAVQHTADARTPWVYGVFIPDAHRHLHLYYRMTLDPQDTGAGWQPATWGFSLASSRKPHSVVVLPANPQDRIEVSLQHRRQPDGRVQPQWQDVATTGGVAVIPLHASGDIWDTIVRVSAGDRTRFAGGVALIPSTDGAPAPDNAFGLWCNACNVTGGGDLGEGEQPWKAWTSRYAPSWYPTHQAIWTVGGTFHGHEVLATQLWLPGEPAHTVVAIDTGGRFTRVLADQVTDVTARPLFAVHLPDADGWLVGAGPDAVVTGWRTNGGEWHAVVSKKAYLVPTDSASIQLRMLVKGKEQIVSRG